MKRLIIFSAIWMAVASLMSVPSVASERRESKFQFTIMWPGDFNVDVDMRILAPDEPSIVDFRKKQGRHIQFLRDELAIAIVKTPPPAPVYFETAVTDTERPGEYVVNVRLYRFYGDRTFPVTVTILVDRISEGGSVSRLLQTTATLSEVRQEKTIVRFVVHDHGGIDSGSANQDFREMNVENRPVLADPVTPEIWVR